MLWHYYFDKLTPEQRQNYSVLVSALSKRRKIANTPFAVTNDTIEAIRKEHPEFADWDIEKSGYGNGAFNHIVVFKYRYPEKTRTQLQVAAKTIADLLPADEETALRSAHNYFLKTVTYNHANIGDTDNYSAFGPLILHTGVCEGIAAALQLVLNERGIDNTVIHGYLEGQGHAWNIVNIKGYNYHVDLTSDMGFTDPKWKKPSYAFYMVTDAEIMKSHVFSDYFGCVQTEANPYFRLGRVFTDETSLKNYLQSVPRTKRLVHFKYFGKKAPNELFDLVSANLRSPVFTRYLTMKENAGTYYFYR